MIIIAHGFHGFCLGIGKVYKEFGCWFVMVDTRRIFVLVLLGMFLVSFMSGFAGAADGGVDPAGDLGDGVPSDVDVSGALSSLGQKGLDWGQSNLKFTSAIGGVDEYKWLLYAILLGMIVYTVISSFFDNSSKYIKWGISIAITAIAMLGIPRELYSALEVQYGAMGSAILAVIPFVVILFFTLKVGSLLIGRLTWGFFTIYMIVMSVLRLISPENIAAGASWPYVIGIAAGIAMFWWMPFWRAKLFDEELKAQEEIAKKKSSVRAAWKSQQESEAESEGGFSAGAGI